jgi:hypothetical protein
MAFLTVENAADATLPASRRQLANCVRSLLVPLHWDPLGVRVSMLTSDRGAVVGPAPDPVANFVRLKEVAGALARSVESPNVGLRSIAPSNDYFGGLLCAAALGRKPSDVKVSNRPVPDVTAFSARPTGYLASCRSLGSSSKSKFVKTSRSRISTADVKKIPAEWPISRMQPRAHDPFLPLVALGSDDCLPR